MGKVVKYYKNIFLRSCDRFTKSHPILDIVIPLAVGLAVGLLESYRVAGRVEPMTTAVVTIIITVLIYAVIYGFFFFREPVILDDEYQKRISELISAEKIILSAVNQKNGDNLASFIKVENNDDRMFEGKLLLVSINKQKVETVFELGTFIGNYRVSKLEYPPSLARLIEFSLIDINSRNAFLVSSETGAWKQIETGEYELQTQLNGKLGTQEIMSKKTTWILKIDRENLFSELSLCQ